MKTTTDYRIIDLLARLHIPVISECGDQIIADCPICKAEKKFYINKNTGAWDCKKGCGQGYPYQLVRDVLNIPPAEIFSILAEYGLAQQQAKATPEQEIERVELPVLYAMLFSQTKQLDYLSLMKLNPEYNHSERTIYLPVYIPSNNKPVGYIRAALDGSPIRLADDTETKYALTKGTKPGLLGLNNLLDSDAIYYVEGWKDLCVALSIGLNAVSPSHGASSWSDGWVSIFRDKHIITIFDRDAAGEAGEAKLAKQLHGIAASIKHLRLPYQKADKHGKDLHDYIYTDNGNIASCDTVEAQAGDETQARVILDDDHPDTIAEAFEAFSRSHGVTHRFHPHDGWSIYKDGRYQVVDPKTQISRYLSEYMRRCYIISEKGSAQRLKLNDSRLKDVLTQLGFLPDVYLRPSMSAPCSLSGRINHNYAIHLTNGILEYENYPYTLHEHTPEFYTFSQLPYSWEGYHDSGLWLDYLMETTQENPELMLLLQQWAGYCVMKHTHNYQKFMLIYGPSGTGKSVYCDVLTAMLGQHNVSNVSLEEFADKHMLSQTYNKLLNHTDEGQNYIEKEVENILKKYTGGSQLTFKRMYESPFEAYPTAKIMISTNDRPEFKDTSDGVWRRLLIAPFTNVVSAAKRNYSLADQIKKTELPGVLKWALEGARHVKEHGFIEPKISVEMLEEYRKTSVPEITFLQDNYCEGELLWGQKPVICGELRVKYEEFCKEEGIKAKSTRRIGETMNRLFPRVKRARARVDGGLVYIYLGLTERTENTDHNIESEAENDIQF